MRCPESVLRGCVVVLVAAGLVGVAGCNKLRARDLLNRGVEAYKMGQFDKAEEDFKQSAQLDPTLQMARIYLATSYASQFVPGSPDPSNIEKGQQAIAEYKKILEQDPKNLSAIDGIGSMLYSLASVPYSEKDLIESKKWHEKHIQIDPNNPEAHYWIGVIDWTLAYHANQKLRMDYNEHLPRRAKPLQANMPLPPKMRDPFASQYQTTVDEGIQELKKAMLLRQNYLDAMAYLNLLYRQKADMVATPEERAALLKKADDLVNQYKEIQQKEASAPKATS